MKKINLIEANKLLTKWKKANAFQSLVQNKSINFIYKVIELQKAITTANSTESLYLMHMVRDSLILECDYYKAENKGFYYKETFNEISLAEIKDRYKTAKADLDYIIEQIKKIELNTYIEIE